MFAEFKINKIDNSLRAGMAIGDFNLYSGENNLKKNPFLYSHTAYSGGWGNGMLPEGKYVIDRIVGPQDIIEHKNADAYTLFNFGWFFAITPQFKTTRSGFGLHPDGNVKGSLGCIVFPFKDLDSNVFCYNVLKGYMEKKRKIDLNVFRT